MPFSLAPPDTLGTIIVAPAGFAARPLTLRDRAHLSGAAMPMTLLARAMELSAPILHVGSCLRTRGRAA